MHGFLTVYKASAGSGKTFTLAAEYIAMIIGNPEDNHRNVLAVTFTNKATAEMKQRVLKELWDMGYKAGYSASDFFQTVARKCPGVDNRQICERAKAALHAILHDYDYFHVKTIDAFFQSLLTSLAHELGAFCGGGGWKSMISASSSRLWTTCCTPSPRGGISPAGSLGMSMRENHGGQGLECQR